MGTNPRNPNFKKAFISIRVNSIIVLGHPIYDNRWTLLCIFCKELFQRLLKLSYAAVLMKSQTCSNSFTYHKQEQIMIV